MCRVTDVTLRNHQPRRAPDDGVGYQPGNGNGNGAGLGSRMICLLAPQLAGELTRTRASRVRARASLRLSS